MNTSKILILQFRTDESLDHERLCFFRHLDLEPAQIEFVRVFGGDHTMADIVQMVKEDVRPLIIAGSGQYYVAKENDTAAMQRDVDELKEVFYPLLRYLLDVRDRAILGICFGHQMLSDCFGSLVYDTQQAETGVLPVTLNNDGRTSPLFEGVSDTFNCVLGHHDSTNRVPLGTTVLASSDRCAVQALDFGDNIYTVQFHPELDRFDLAERLMLYAHYADHSSEDSIADARVTDAPKILNNFLRIADIL